MIWQCVQIYTNEWMVYNHTNNNIEYDDACKKANKWIVYNYIKKYYKIWWCVQLLWANEWIVITTSYQ